MLSFEEIEDCFPDGAVSLPDGWTGVTAQWLHDFAHAVAAKEREACAKVCADHPGHIPSNRWNASSALGSCEQAIRMRSNVEVARRHVEANE